MDYLPMVMPLRIDTFLETVDLQESLKNRTRRVIRTLVQALIIKNRTVLTLGGDWRSPLWARGSYSSLVRPENENTLELDLMSLNLYRIIQIVALASEHPTSVVFESVQ